MLNVEDIEKLIPHRYPFLLIDKVIEFPNEDSILALKNLSANESFFQGHFPTMKVMPGVLAVEACAQSAAILYAYFNKNNNSIFYLATISYAKFRIAIKPGDSMYISTIVEQKGRSMWKFKSEVFLESKTEKKAAECAFGAFLAEQ